MRVLINAASAHMGGSITHLQNILRWLPEEMPVGRVVVYVPEATGDTLPSRANVDVRAYPYDSTQGLRRLYFDQVEIPRLVRREDIDVLFSATGFGTLWSPVSQVLLVRNMAYFDPQFQAKYRELGRSFTKTRLHRWHSLLSIWAAEAVLFPTRAMQNVVETYVPLNGKTTYALHYGLDEERFGKERKMQSNAGYSVQQETENEELLLLNVSTYALHKNLETLIEALPFLLDRHPNLTLVTTTSREQTSDKTEYDALKERAAELAVADRWVELGYVPYEKLPAVYRAADVYVFPSFTESFGHSMVEAMACGLPVVAADTAVHREVCGAAASYFDTFDATDCAETIHQVVADRDRRAKSIQDSVRRAEHFSWKRYTEQLAEVFQKAA